MKSEEVKYTVATIIGIEKGPKTSKSFKYKYIVNNDTLVSEEFIENKYKNIFKKNPLNLNLFINKKFFVKYSKKYTVFNDILLDKPIKDTIITLPINNFDSIPGNLVDEIFLEKINQLLK